MKTDATTKACAVSKAISEIKDKSLESTLRDFIFQICTNEQFDTFYNLLKKYRPEMR